MKTTHIAACILLVVGTTAFAQTPAATSSVPGPSVHKAKIDPAPAGAMTIKEEHKAEKKAKLAAMSPDERKAYKADRKAKKEAKLAAMTPEQRKQHDQRKADKKAARTKGK